MRQRSLGSVAGSDAGERHFRRLRACHGDFTVTIEDPLSRKRMNETVVVFRFQFDTVYGLEVDFQEGR